MRISAHKYTIARVFYRVDRGVLIRKVSGMVVLVGEGGVHVVDVDGECGCHGGEEGWWWWWWWVVVGG